MKHLLFALILLLQTNLTLALDTVTHPAPKEPKYIASTWYETLKKQIPLPPKKADKAQKEDETTLLKLQKNRTVTDCERAKSEIFVSLENFFGKPNGPLEPEKLRALVPFFDSIRNDADYFVQKLKVDFPRDRPFVYLKEINPCVAKEVTKAYPSGHGTISKLYAMILSDFFPGTNAQLDERSKKIGEDRVLAGMHHPTDIEAGRKIADLIYQELQKSEKYQRAFNEAKRKL